MAMRQKYVVTEMFLPLAFCLVTAVYVMMWIPAVRCQKYLVREIQLTLAFCLVMSVFLWMGMRTAQLLGMLFMEEFAMMMLP
jgi:hypothetical protein